MGSVTSYCSVGWRGRDWGQGDRLRGHHRCPDGSGEPQGCGSRDGEKGMPWGFKRQNLLVLVTDEMKSRGLCCFHFEQTVGSNVNDNCGCR